MTAISIGSLHNNIIVLVYFRSHDKLYFPESTGIHCNNAMTYHVVDPADQMKDFLSITSLFYGIYMELKLLSLRHSTCTILSLTKITDNTHNNNIIISSEYLFSLSFHSCRYDMDLHRVALTQFCVILVWLWSVQNKLIIKHIEVRQNKARTIIDTFATFFLLSYMPS